MVTRARDAGLVVRELHHTADVGFEVTARTLPEVFERAGLALLGTVADLGQVEPRERREMTVTADSREELLHDWLQALLVAFQARGFLACELDVQALDGSALRAVVAGEMLDSVRHTVHGEVKGVTYHRLAVEETAAGWCARCVLDV